MIKTFDLTLILLITLHWSFSLGQLIAMKTSWSIPRFIMTIFIFRYLALSYGY
jgi:hypothetical protein